MANDHEDVEAGSKRRKNERESSIEDVFASVRADLGERSYPTTSEELAGTYADGSIDLPNETESLDSAFDRMDDQFEDAEAAYRAFLSEFEDGAYRDLRPDAASGGAVWSEERADDEQPPAQADSDLDGHPAQQRASQEQASDDRASGSDSDDAQ
ncbi:DUF5789 family protein [Salinarchaeum laminariae]|uniref:DUF5789 family protein n=1 Tax=Salinarchaeum laminariae TaxID=869888 RepID=UPI0020BE939E|nr:hypothetical protein [Salinarchaeum laminariae]